MGTGLLKKLAETILRQAYSCCRVFSRLFRNRQRRRILLCCNSVVMKEHLLRFRQVFEDDHRLEFRIVFFNRGVSKTNQSIAENLPVKPVNRLWAFGIAWDLIVMADHVSSSLLDMKKFKTVFIGHGAPSKCFKQGRRGDRTFKYGKRAFDNEGLVRYSRMFEGHNRDRERAVTFNPKLADIIAVVGSLANDELLAEAERREGIRQELGFSPRDKVVLFLSTWGKNCLFNTIGDEIINEASRLLKQYRFVLNIHPNECRPNPHGGRVWGSYFRTLRSKGFLVTDPNKSWIPYLIASDVVITDHSSLCQSAALLEKPVIFAPVPEELILKGSFTWEIQQLAPVLHDVRKLGENLEKIVNGDYPFSELKELSRKICSRPGQAAGRVREETCRLLKLPPLQIYTGRTDPIKKELAS